ncbi:MAG: prepilin-type N-terminal cleavage/methylation domain-containing protein [Pseudomonadota bacterium]
MEAARQHVESGQRGLSLTELLITLSILAITAAVAVPALRGTPDRSLDLALRDLTFALEYAREMSRATGQRHGIAYTSSGPTIQVIRLNSAGQPVRDVINPITKRTYILSFAQDSRSALDSLGGGIQWRGNCSEPNILVFDPSGFVRCSDPVSTQLNSAQLFLRRNGQQRTLVVDGETGRVAFDVSPNL